MKLLLLQGTAESGRRLIKRVTGSCDELFECGCWLPCGLPLLRGGLSVSGVSEKCPREIEPKPKSP